MSLTNDDYLKMFTGTNGLNVGIDTAIKALRPNAKFTMGSVNGKFTFSNWKDSGGLEPPTTEEVMAEFEKQKKVAEYYQYAFDRCKEYPDGFEQFDMLWHAVNNGIDLKDSEWFKKIKEVKDRNPKPTGEVPV
jgi:hypothetical protein